MNEGELLTALREKLKTIEAAGEALGLSLSLHHGSNIILQVLPTLNQTAMISRMNNRIKIDQLQVL